MMCSLGKRLRALRVKKGVTQIDLAKGLCTPSMISQIESDRAKPSYKMLHAIAERLGVTTDELLNDVEMNLDQVSAYKMVKAMVASKDYVPAVPLLRTLLSTPRSKEQRMDLQRELGECLTHTGQFEEAEQMLTQVQEYALIEQNERLSALTLKSLGQLEFNRQRYPLAVYLWTKALQEEAKLPEPVLRLRGSLHDSLGQAHIKLNKPELAVESYEQARRLYELVGSMQEIGQVYLGLGLAYQMTDQVEKSMEYSGKAISVFEGLDNLLLMLQHQIECATRYSQSGQSQEAEAMFRTAIAKLRHFGKPEDTAAALVEYAAFCHREGRLPEAEEACMQARVLLPETHLYQARINRVLARVNMERDEEQQAIQRYIAAADRFAQSEEVGEWGDTMQELSTLYVKQNDYEQAFRILDSVRSYTNEVLGNRGIAL
ncbi:helix-turn-helix domain-containing protein [Tumebacillus lacus]|nr:helix-turn-helix transcriptional regulator [Tumebacillus lacus]